MQRKIIETTPADAAKRLGINLTTMYRRLESRNIAAIKNGSKWRVFLVEVRLPESNPFWNSLPYSALEDILGPELAQMFAKEG